MNIKFNKIITRFGFFILAVGALIACENTAKNNTAKKENIQDTISDVDRPQVADVSFKDKEGNIVSLSSLKGKIVFINFWATWCPPCIHEMPSINELHKKFKDNEDVAFLMIDVDNAIEESTAFMEKNKYDLPLYTPASEIPAEFLGGSIPTTVILDKAGNIVERVEGSRDYSTPEIVAALTKLAQTDH